VGMRGVTWHHHEACVEAKQSREEIVAIRCTGLELDHFAPGLSGSAKISKDVLNMCNSFINKIGVVPTNHLFH
jgi:hypothetical protein